MRTVRKRTCTGLSLTASYWSEQQEPAGDVDPGLADLLAAEVAAALNGRCEHPVYLPRLRERMRARRV